MDLKTQVKIINYQIEIIKNTRKEIEKMNKKG